MARHLQPTPSIVVEDVDRIQTRLEFQSPPSYTLKIQDNNNCHSPLSLCTSFGIIKPDVDAYVTPLSLCQQPSTPISPSVPVYFPVEFTCAAICFVVLLKLIDWKLNRQSREKVIVVSGGAMPPCLATSGLESSFTSVDIGGPNHPAARSIGDNDSSWNSDVSHQTTGCFDLK